MADDFFSIERKRMERIFQAFQKKHAPSVPANDINPNDPDIASIISSFSYSMANLNSLVSTTGNDFYQLLGRNIFGSLVNAKPCATMVDVKDGFGMPLLIKKGSRMTGGKNTPKGDEIIYTAASDTRVYPFYFRDFSFAENKGFIQIKFSIENRATNPHELNFQYLDISFSANGDIIDASRMYLLFHMARIVEVSSPYGGVHEVFPDNFYPYGFQNATSIYPLPEFEFEDTAVIMDYCKLPEKMYSFRWEITPNVLELFRKSSILTLTIYVPMVLKRFFPNEKAFQSALSFNMVPMVNLFDEKSVPSRINHYNNLIPLAVADSKGEKFIYNIDQVVGIDVESDERRTYMDFSDYINSGERKSLVYTFKIGGQPTKPLYHIQLAYGDEQVLFKKESLIAFLTCSNGAKGVVEAGELVKFAATGMEAIVATNVMRSSDYTPPILETGTASLMLNQIKISKLDLDNLDAVKSLLHHLFALAGATDYSKIDAISDFYWKQGTHIDSGKLIYGQEISLIVDINKFNDEMGEILVFGNVIASVFATHSPINFYTRLSFYSANNPTAPILTLAPVCGDRVLQRTINTLV